MSHLKILRKGELSKLTAIGGSLLRLDYPQSQHSISDPISIVARKESAVLLESITGFATFPAEIESHFEPLLLLSLYLAKFSNECTAVVDDLIKKYSSAAIWSSFNDRDLTMKLNDLSTLEWSAPIVLELERIRTLNLLQSNAKDDVELSKGLQWSYGYIIAWNAVFQEITTLNLRVLSKHSRVLGKSWFTPDLMTIIRHYIDTNAYTEEMLKLLAVHAELGESEPFGLITSLYKFDPGIELKSQIAWLICSYYTKKCTLFQILELREWFPKELVLVDENVRTLAGFLDSLDNQCLQFFLSFFLRAKVRGNLERKLGVSKAFYFVAENRMKQSTTFTNIIFGSPLKEFFKSLTLETEISNFAQLGVWRVAYAVDYPLPGFKVVKGPSMPFLLGEVGILDEDSLLDCIKIMVDITGYFKLPEGLKPEKSRNELLEVMETLEFKTIGNTCKAVKEMLNSCCDKYSFNSISLVIETLKTWSANLSLAITENYCEWDIATQKDDSMETYHQYVSTLFLATIVIISGYALHLNNHSSGRPVLDVAILEILLDFSAARSKLVSGMVPQANQIESILARNNSGTGIIEKFIATNLEPYIEGNAKSLCKLASMTNFANQNFYALDSKYVKEHLLPIITAYLPRRTIPSNISHLFNRVRNSSHLIVAQCFNSSFRYQEYCKTNCISYINSILDEDFFATSFNTIIIGLCDFSPSRLRKYHWIKDGDGTKLSDWKSISSKLAWKCIELLVDKIATKNNESDAQRIVMNVLFEQINNLNIENLRRLLKRIEILVLTFSQTSFINSFMNSLYDQVSKNDAIDYQRRYGVTMWYLELADKILKSNDVKVKAKL